MRKGLWRKGLAGGMILLVLGVCVLSNINGTMVTANTPLDRINNPLVQEKYTVLFIGLIKDMVKIDDNRYEFRFIRAVAWGFHNGEYISFTYIHGYDYLVDFTFETKIGFIRNHVICGVFTYYFPNAF